MMFGFFRIAAAVPRLEVANPVYNSNEIIKLYRKAARENAAAVVFPELCISGYSCADLFFNRRLLSASLDALRKIIESSKSHDTVGIVGLPVLADGALFNAAAVFKRGELLGVAGKSVLPNHREFYEKRQFTSVREKNGAIFAFDGKRFEISSSPVFESANHFRFGVEICEDLWSVIPVSCRLAAAGAQVIFNPSAGTEIAGKAEYRRNLVAGQSGRIVGGYVLSGAGVHESTSDTVFGGHAIIAENGKIVKENQRFKRESSLIFADLDMEKLENERFSESSFNDFSPPEKIARVSVGQVAEPKDIKYAGLERFPFAPSEPKELFERCLEVMEIQTAALTKRWEHTGADRLVIGLSGGLDSTLAALVCLQSCKTLNRKPSSVLAVTMPGFGTGKRTKNNAAKLAHLLGFELRTIPIEKAVRQHFADIGHDEKVMDAAYENSQARERTQILMDLANQENGIVVGTGDLSEIALGWNTFNGDHMSMYNVNSSIPKTMVRHLVEFVASQSAGELLQTLFDIANTPISPELLPASGGAELAQETEKVIGRYELHDFFLYHFVQSGMAPEKLEFIANCAFADVYDPKEIKSTLQIFLRRFISQQFKRHAFPEGPKVGTVSLSPRGDWRMPADASFEIFLK